MARLLRLAALLSSALILIGFAAFAVDEVERGSKTQQEKLANELGEPAPAPAGERQRERRQGGVREAIDDANDFLLSPFTDVVDSDNAWVARAAPSLLGLLLYGLGLGMLANFLPKSSRRGDWRTPGASRVG